MSEKELKMNRNTLYGNFNNDKIKCPYCSNKIKFSIEFDVWFCTICKKIITIRVF